MKEQLYYSGYALNGDHGHLVSTCTDLSHSFSSFCFNSTQNHALTTTINRYYIPFLQQSGDIERAKECWIKASTGHKAQRSPWHAAKALEKAADLSRESKDYSEIEELYSQCADLYLEEGRPQAAAEAITRAAGALSETNPPVATRLFSQAIEWLEECGKDRTNPDVYRQAIAHAVRNDLWNDAASFLLRFAVSSYSAGAMASMSKSYLGAVLVWLYAENGKNAWDTYQDALGVSEFASSDQAFAAEDLITAYRTQSLEAIQSTLANHSCFKHLDNCIAKLTKMLDTTDIKKASQGLGGSVLTQNNDDEEEDLT